MHWHAGHLIAFEGLDQSGKQTQAELLRDRLKQDGRKARLVSFPDYGTSIGEEIARALQGEREYGADVMQLLYVANRYERKRDLQRWLDGGLILVCDRYLASSVAYGEAQGLDPAWLADMQKFLPPPSLTILLDIAPETAVTAQGGRPRSLRARPGAAGARARELPAPGRAPATGWCSTASGRRTRRRRCASRAAVVTTRAAVSARTSRDARLLQHPRARLERRAGRAHIVHQHDDAPRSAARAPRAQRERAADVALPLARRADPVCVGGGAHAPQRRARPAGRDAARDRPPD